MARFARSLLLLLLLRHPPAHFLQSSISVRSSRRQRRPCKASLSSLQRRPSEDGALPDATQCRERADARSARADATQMSCARERRWWLGQANHAAAGRILTLAHRLDVADVEGWASRVLACAQRAGASDGKDVLQAAELAALGWRSASPPATAALSVQDVRRLAGERSTAQPQGPVPAADASSTWRSATAARAAFNNPDHWVDSGDGRVEPDPARLEGESALAWQSLTDKFGAPLAKNLFDAKARGGNATAVIDAMSAAGSRLTLTVRDLGRLQLVCFANGEITPDLSSLTLHDTFHSYGTSMFEETYGDAHTEGLVRSLFSTKDSSKIAVDAGKPLGEQPAVVQQLKVRIEQDFASVTPLDLTYNIRAAFYQTDGWGYESFKHDWYEAPSQNARLVAEVLESNGALAHLDTATRTRVNALIHDAGDPDSIESISSTLERALATDYFAGGTFPPKFTAWLERLNNVLREGSQGRMMSRAQYSEHAAQAIAMSLVLERAAPGSLALGPSGTSLGDQVPAHPLDTFDLRKAYPAALREVRAALGLAP